MNKDKKIEVGQVWKTKDFGTCMVVQEVVNENYFRVYSCNPCGCLCGFDRSIFMEAELLATYPTFEEARDSYEFANGILKRHGEAEAWLLMTRAKAVCERIDYEIKRNILFNIPAPPNKVMEITTKHIADALQEAEEGKQAALAILQAEKDAEIAELTEAVKVLQGNLKTETRNLHRKIRDVEMHRDYLQEFAQGIVVESGLYEESCRRKIPFTKVAEALREQGRQEIKEVLKSLFK